MKFLDEAKIYVKSGDGGPGCISFRREKYEEMGGPNGGNGGRGGDIVFEAQDALNTLIDFRYTQHFRAPNGEHGKGKDRSGAKGDTIVIKVPVGTQIMDDDKQTILFDMTEVGQRITFLTGGDGGFGNAHYKSSTNQAPRKKTPGWPGEERAIWLRLKLIADVGLLGMPNAGKSTFLAAVSKAKPKIADYPFTTLHPNLGVVKAGDFDFVIADIPGLIEGAHEGTGLGTRFLGHVERTAVLLHLVDCTQDDPVKAYDIIRNELKMYGGALYERHEIVCLTKMDALGEELTQSVADDFEASTGIKPMIMSAVAAKNTDKVLYKLAEVIKASRYVPEKDDLEDYDKSYDERFEKAMGINEESYDALPTDE